MDLGQVMGSETMKVLGAREILGSGGCSTGRKRREENYTYNKVGGILTTTQFPLRPTLYIVSVIISVFFEKGRKFLV